jgi:hypothetical protein
VFRIDLQSFKRKKDEQRRVEEAFTRRYESDTLPLRYHP